MGCTLVGGSDKESTTGFLLGLVPFNTFSDCINMQSVIGGSD